MGPIFTVHVDIPLLLGRPERMSVLLAGHTWKMCSSSKGRCTVRKLYLQEYLHLYLSAETGRKDSEKKGMKIFMSDATLYLKCPIYCNLLMVLKYFLKIVRLNYCALEKLCF
jgi:hypothetical protein